MGSGVEVLVVGSGVGGAVVVVVGTGVEVLVVGSCVGVVVVSTDVVVVSAAQLSYTSTSQSSNCTLSELVSVLIITNL